ncbi:MAG TPA: hypothetical protein VGG25_18015 [Streptosporangiaceae bacterium]|jgi:hypothetical protein
MPSGSAGIGAVTAVQQVPLPGAASARREMYRARLEVGHGLIPAPDPTRHTMGSAIDAYVAQRVPRLPLDHALASGLPVEVHGIYPAHLRDVLPGATELTTDWNIRPGKIYNWIRPKCFLAPREDGVPGSRLIVAVPPGRDYVLHYASLVRHYAQRCGAALGLVARYPAAELSIATWTGLRDLVGPADRVLIGYVQQLVPLLSSQGATVIARQGNAYCEMVRLAFPGGTVVSAIGVKFSFWGCISARLAAACREQGARELIYAGKLGTLTDPADIYARLFVPSCYAVPGPVPGLLPAAQAPPNPLLERYPGLDTGVHMSVGTVLEEDVTLRARARGLHTTSMDNEISQIAAAAGDGPAPQTAFSALHFATDYLSGEPRRLPRGTFNLTNNRRDDALVRRQAMLTQVAALLTGYYDRRPVFRGAHGFQAVAAIRLARQNGADSR